MRQPASTLPSMALTANIYFYDIDTPLKRFVVSQPNLVRHCEAIHAAVSKWTRAKRRVTAL